MTTTELASSDGELLAEMTTLIPETDVSTSQKMSTQQQSIERQRQLLSLSQLSLQLYDMIISKIRKPYVINKVTGMNSQFRELYCYQIAHYYYTKHGKATLIIVTYNWYRFIPNEVRNDVIRYIIEKYALDVNYATRELFATCNNENGHFIGFPVLTLAVMKRRDASYIKVLLDHGADPNVTFRGDSTPLTIAIEKNYVEIAKLLLKCPMTDPFYGKKSEFGKDVSSPLLSAVKSGHKEIVDMIIRARMDKIKSTFVYKGTSNDVSLINASTSTENALDVYLKRLMSIDNYDHIALFEACKKGYSEIVALLLAFGADQFVNIPEGYLGHMGTLLINTAKNSYTSIVDLLIIHGAKQVQSRRYFRGRVQSVRSPLSIAAMRENVQMFEILFNDLIENGIIIEHDKTSEVDDEVDDVIDDNAIVDDNNNEVNVDVDKANIYGAYYRMQREKRRNDRRMKKMRSKICIEYCSDNDVSIGNVSIGNVSIKEAIQTELTYCLTEACSWRSTEIVRLLLNSKELLASKGITIDLDHRDLTFRSPLSSAVEDGDISIVQMLLDAGASIELSNRELKESHRTQMLLLAAINSRKNPEEMTKFILTLHGIDINGVDRYGNSALIDAAACECTHIVKILLDAGADPNIISKDGHTALSYAREKDYTEIIEILAPVTTAIGVIDYENE